MRQLDDVGRRSTSSPTRRGALRWRHSRGGIFELAPGTAVSLKGWAQIGFHAEEAGGLLIGEHHRDGYDIVVVDFTPPQPDDHRERFAFHSTSPEHGRYVEAAWKASGGKRNRVGDWHTHAEPVPSPSPIDLETWRQTLREVGDNEACFFVVVGQAETRVWQGERSTMTIALCEPVR